VVTVELARQAAAVLSDVSCQAGYVEAQLCDHAWPGERRLKTVKIGELKNRLSYYLRRVQQGESILVCDRDRVIARIERVSQEASVPASDAQWLDRLERRGMIRRGSGKLSRAWLAKRPRVKADVVAALLEQREDSR